MTLPRILQGMRHAVWASCLASALRRGAGLVLAVAASSALAQSPELAPLQDHALIGNQVLEGAQGRIGVNLAAGRGNLQANGLSMAIGAQAQASALANQQTLTAPTTSPALDATARIEAGAFRDSQGIISVNQAAGEFNRQANLISVAVVSDAPGDLAATDEQLISASAGGAIASGLTPRGGQRQVHADAGAFDRAQGIVQVNQVAGVQNTVTNSVVLRVSGPGTL
jgi:hypothetical protein